LSPNPHSGILSSEISFWQKSRGSEGEKKREKKIRGDIPQTQISMRREWVFDLKPKTQFSWEKGRGSKRNQESDAAPIHICK
jgi:hypothetical protein